MTDLSRRDFLKTVGAGITATGMGALSLPSCSGDDGRHRNGASSRPNIILFITDQERYPWHLESATRSGELAFSTPHRDSLHAAGAVELANHCVTNPICSPSRGTMLTGLYPHQNGVMDNIEMQEDMSPGVRTIGHMMSAAGYRVGYKGKWHLSRLFPCFGQGALSAYGFDDFGCGHFTGDSHIAWQDDAENGDAAADWIRARRGESEPWFLVVSIVNPHDIYWPMLFPREEWEGRYDPIGPDNVETAEQLMANKPAPHANALCQYATYGHLYADKGFHEYTMEDWRVYLSFYCYLIEMMDAELGKVLTAARELDPHLDDTVVVTTSDHGDMGGSHGLPYKDHFVYKEVLHVPMLVKYPGSENRRIEGLTSHIDLVPTLCGFAGATAAANVPIPGVDLGPLLAGATDTAHDEGIFAEGDFTVAREKNALHAVVADLDGGRWKYVNYLTETENNRELYDLTADPQELDNLAASAPDVMARLQERIDAWQASTPVDPNVESG